MFTIDSTDDRALSPVIGVILLVGITVILVAVVGGLVTDFGSDVDVAPNAQLAVDDFEDGRNSFNLSHESGDNLDSENIVLELNGSEPTDLTEYDGTPDTFQAGDEIDIDMDNSSISGESSLSSGDELSVIWVGSDSREVMLEESVP